MVATAEALEMSSDQRTEHCSTPGNPTGAYSAPSHPAEIRSAEYPTGLKGIPPHLDVVIDREGSIPLAIESKFTEPYSPASNGFRDSYFQEPGLWDGFDHVRILASGIANGSVQFKHLGAAQLIKHALGLKNEYGPGGFRLLYLYYEWPSAVADAHRTEIDWFAEIAQLDLEFAPMTYQELFERLKTTDEPRPGYMAYLSDRYFSPR